MTTDLQTPRRLNAGDRPRRPIFKRSVPWLLVAVWVGVLVGMLPLAGNLESVTQDNAIDYLPASAESTKVLEVEENLPGGERGLLMVAYERLGGLEPGDLQEVESTRAELIRQFGGNPNEPPRISESDDGSALVYALPLDREVLGEDGKAVTTARELVQGGPDGLTPYVAGPTALESDMDKVFDTVDSTLLLTTALVVALILILTYRSPFLWLVPLVSVGIAALTTMGIVYGLTKITDITVTSMSSALMIVLVFGAATDYGLLLVARYREELRRRERPIDAMLVAIRAAGPAILASAATVSAGLLCLMLADLNSMRGLGPVGAVAIVCSVLAMLTLFPALMVLLGRRVFWPFIPRPGVEAHANGWWTRLGEVIARRRIVGWAAPMLILAALALGTIGANDRLPQLEQFANSTPESVAGQQMISDRYPEQSGQPVTIVSREERSADVLDAVEQTPGVADAELGRVGGGWAEISATPADAPGSNAESATIELLRDQVHDVDGADAMVGGTSAQTLDVDETTKSDRNLVIPLILLTVVAILCILLRALVAPLVLMATVVVSFFGALGLSNLLYEQVLGFGGLEPSVPLIGFLFLVALGVDYNIFLMSRVREETVAHGTVDGTKRGLAMTGGVITSAGIVMAATFAVLATLPLVVMVEIGLLVAIGVLIDTLIVRSVVVPALTMSLGSRIWWPGRLRRAG